MAFGFITLCTLSKIFLIEIATDYKCVYFRVIAPKLTIYICQENTTVFNAVFLSSHNNMEMLQKLTALTGVSQEKVSDIYMQGPQSINIRLSNDVITHIKDETMFSLQIIQDNGNYIFVLKPMVK